MSTIVEFHPSEMVETLVTRRRGKIERGLGDGSGGSALVRMEVDEGGSGLG